MPVCFLPAGKCLPYYSVHFPVNIVTDRFKLRIKGIGTCVHQKERQLFSPFPIRRLDIFLFAQGKAAAAVETDPSDAQVGFWLLHFQHDQPREMLFQLLHDLPSIALVAHVRRSCQMFHVSKSIQIPGRNKPDPDSSLFRFIGYQVTVELRVPVCLFALCIVIPPFCL